ncbi:hypothetical protein RHMOL_Rhmol06G0308500 [Rhododendron molle]|uniref:Uncharacterized protein n=1 Tax=Rhododendron molle TaxID=49168 RepID=A0ACC0NIV6_RHOML|nr:hypothetical protein RHMOL_Rhmol06G0308500 [Rhododendron molle]
MHLLAGMDFNSYSSHCGNDEVMVRGTFANIRLVNKLLNGEVGPKTIHIPTGEKLSVFGAAMRYKVVAHDLGAEYGSGSSRDWAAKGPMLLVEFNHGGILLYVIQHLIKQKIVELFSPLKFVLVRTLACYRVRT